MSRDTVIIATDTSRLGGMLAAARDLGGCVTVAVAGSRELADAAAAMGPDQVRWFAPLDDAPVEASVSQIAEAAAAEAPRVVMSSTTPAARVLLGAAAAKLGAAVVSAAQSLGVEGDDVTVRRSVADGRAVETVAVAGPVACIYDGDDADRVLCQAAPVEEIAAIGDGEALRVVEIRPALGDTGGLRTAGRVVGVGLGIVAKDDLKLVEDLAAALGAAIGCSLPVCDDMRWYGQERVIGRSHTQIAPDLYIAVGVSGQPQHTVGVRDAKVVVAVNNDPKATFFKHCDYGIEGDLYKVVPALTAAIQQG